MRVLTLADLTLPSTALSHNRETTGGYARQQTVSVFPIATEMAGESPSSNVEGVTTLTPLVSQASRCA